MTGIGFLGAGVIFKEGLSVRPDDRRLHLDHVAAIGIPRVPVSLYATGHFWPRRSTGQFCPFYRWIEAHMPAHFYAHHFVRFACNEAMPSHQFKTFLGRACGLQRSPTWASA